MKVNVVLVVMFCDFILPSNFLYKGNGEVLVLIYDFVHFDEVREVDFFI